MKISRGIRETLLIVFGLLGLLVLISLLSYTGSDPGWSHTGTRDVVVQNMAGRGGAWLSDLLFYLLGYLAYLLPAMLFWTGWLLFRGDSDSGEVDVRLVAWRWFGFLLTLVAGCSIAALDFAQGSMPASAGGVLGDAFGHWIAGIFGKVGSTLLLLGGLLGGLTLFTGVSTLQAVDWVGGFVMSLIDRVYDRWLAFVDNRKLALARAQHEAVLKKEKARLERHSRPHIEPSPARVAPTVAVAAAAAFENKEDVRVEPVIAARPAVAAPATIAPGVPAAASTPSRPEIKPRTAKDKLTGFFQKTSGSDDPLPPLDLLDPPTQQVIGYSAEELEALSRQVELKLKEFNVDVVVESVHPGPVVTRFELMLAPGTKVSKITGLAKDIARSLSVMSVRVVEVIQGKSTIGLEIPNEEREMVVLSEIIASREFERQSSALTVALGKDISGLPIVANLAKMPHLLVAGTTGSGKSVGVNAMLVSLLYKATPEEVRLILIDPKMLELSVYADIPHLLAPVVTDMKDAGNALRWSVAEMERRYKLMSKLGVRNLAGYNDKVRAAIKAGEPIVDPLWEPTGLRDDEEPPDLEVMPFIVVVVDEFADMMMVVGKKVEELIARLAQKARAAGIHLILATQRPSVDVITGLIKANIPTRIAFQVSSKIDSRTILDQMGAEMLLGMGDMLYLPPGTSMTERVHGAFVSDHEVHAVAEYVRGTAAPNYLPEILEGNDGSDDFIPGLEPMDGDSEGDALYDQAVAIVTESRKASISYVQRRLKIGYNRAARMIEQMEAAGVVTSPNGQGQREVMAPPPPR